MYMKRSLRLHNYLKTLLVLVFFGFNAQVSFGQLLVEPFNYSPSAGSLSSQTSSAWTDLNSGDNILVTSNSLAYSGLASSTGNKILFDGTGMDAARLFTQQTSGTIYYSFLLNISSLGSLNAAGSYFTGFNESVSTTFGATIWVRRDTGGVGYNLGVNPRTTAANTSWSTAVYSVNTTLMVVISYQIVAGVTNDAVKIWINPTPGSAEPTATSSATNSLTDLANINRIILRQDGNTTTPFIQMDEIRVGTTWESVTPASTTWTTAWSNGLPDASKEAIIDGVFNTNGTGEEIPFTAKKLTVTTNGNLTINAGTNITVQDDVINNGLLTVESNANLVQVNNATNSGTISVKRDTNPLMRFDYVMWSSPVDGTQTLTGFSPLTSVSPTVRFYNYDSATNLYTSILAAATTEFTNATGYLIRLPFDHPTAPTTWTGTFSGVPNNGPISLGSLTSGLYYATGNPYPSTISADAFIAANSLNDALYFWRKTNGATGSAYATYTTAGGTSPAPGTTASPSSGVPNGTIQVGQGFIAKANGTSLVFNNTMRTTNIANQTFRSTSSELPTTIEKNRFWLNLSNATETIGQTLVSYMTGATNGLDAQIDGKYINDSATALTSLIAGEEFAIQGKTLPFTATDVVPLGFKTETAGNYSISIFDKDGLFSDNGQIIYLRDNLTNTIQNLNSGAYNFTSQAGVFNGRFDVVYQNALSTDVVDFISNNVTVYNQNNVLNINSGSNTMSAVKVYDVLGRLLAQSNKVNATQTQITVPATNQTLIVQITSSEGTVVVKKVAN